MDASQAGFVVVSSIKLLYTHVYIHTYTYIIASTDGPCVPPRCLPTQVVDPHLDLLLRHFHGRAGLSQPVVVVVVWWFGCVCVFCK